MHYRINQIRYSYTTRPEHHQSKIRYLADQISHLITITLGSPFANLGKNIAHPYCKLGGKFHLTYLSDIYLLWNHTMCLRCFALRCKLTWGFYYNSSCLQRVGIVKWAVVLKITCQGGRMGYVVWQLFPNASSERKQRKETLGWCVKIVFWSVGCDGM